MHLVVAEIQMDQRLEQVQVLGHAGNKVIGGVDHDPCEKKRSEEKCTERERRQKG